MRLLSIDLMNPMVLLVLGVFVSGCTTSATSTRDAADADASGSLSPQNCTVCAARGVSAPGHTAQVHDTSDVATVSSTGICCPMCGTHAQKRLGKLDGVEWVDVNLHTGDVFVGLDPETPRPAAAALQEEIRKSGFTPGAVTLPESEPQR